MPSRSNGRRRRKGGRPSAITTSADERRRTSGARFVIIASQFNAPITQALIRGATDVLRRHGVPPRAIRLLWVPGAFELPVVAAHVAKSRKRPDAIIALGAILRGETVQYEVLAHTVAQGLSQVAVSTTIPVTFGVVVAKTLAEARARAGPPRLLRKAGRGGTVGNRGAEAAMAALAVLRLFETMT